MTTQNKQQIIEDYFGTSVEEVKNEEFKVNGKWYQVQAVDYINNDDELKGLADTAIEHAGFYIIEQ